MGNFDTNNKKITQKRTLYSLYKIKKKYLSKTQIILDY